MLILERGEPAELPPTPWIKGRRDPVHDYRDPEGASYGNRPERFASNQRRAAGPLELLHVAGDAID